MTDTINVGSSANDHTGDLMRTAFIKINAKFNEIAAAYNFRGAWLTGAVYDASARDYVLSSGTYYLAATSHTAGVFATDLAAGKWVVTDFAGFSARLAGNAGAGLVGTLDGRTAQARIDALPAEVSAVVVGEANRAEAARDAAIVGAGVYTSEAVGRAAVADGVAFKVQGSAEVAAYEYRRVNAGSSTLIATYPSILAVQAQAARVPGYITPPALTDPLYKVLEIEIYKTINGTAVTLPALMCVRECGRDATSGGRFRLRLSGYDGVSVYTAALREQGNGTYLPVDGSYIGERWIDLYTVDTSLGVSASTLVGRARVDFGAGAVFGTYAGTIAYAVGGIYTAELQATPRFANDTTDLINAVVAVTAGSKLPFVDSMNNADFRRMIKSIYLYGADPTHQYVVSSFALEQFPGVPQTRFLMIIRDLTAALDVCRYSYVVASVTPIATFCAQIPPTIKLVDDALGTPTRIYAVATLDFTGQAATYVGAATTMTQGGIHARQVFSDDMIADYLSNDHRHQVIRVGAGQAFTTLRAAVESIYTSLSDKQCDASHYHNRILIDLVDDGTYNATFLTIPAFVEVRGNGVDRTFIAKESDVTDALLEVHLDTKFSDCTIISATGDGGAWGGEYCLHSDDFNRKSQGGTAQNRRLRQSFKRMKLIGGASQNAWLFGCGVSSGQTILFEDVIAEHTNMASASAAFGFHNTGPTLSVPAIAATYKPPLVEMRGCRSPDALAYGVYLQSLEAGAVARLMLQNCDFNLILQTVASGDEVVTDKAADRYGWEIGGVHAGPILQNDPYGMLVLGTTAGAAVSGTAATAIFGTVDELGRGDLWIKTGTVKSLGARLGDCSSVNKTLTIAGQTWTANANHTAQSNATIIAAINAVITTNPVAEVNIQYEIYPNTGFTRRMLNSTGATIPKGSFVKRTGANTIAPAAGSDDVFGWVCRDIRNTYSGNVITTKKVHTAYISGAGGDGKFGLTAGVLDYGAATKVGFVSSSIVTLY